MLEGEVAEIECEAAAAAAAVVVEATALGLGPEPEIVPGPSVRPVGLAEIEPRHLVDLASVAAWLVHQLQKAWMLWPEPELE